MGDCTCYTLMRTKERDKLSHMEAFLKGHRGSSTKRFLGVIGSYLVEILDDDPIIKKLLAASCHSHSPSTDSRFRSATKRLILKSFSGDALVIIKTKPGSSDYNECELASFINNSREDSETLLNDARELAKHRWQKISF